MAADTQDGGDTGFVYEALPARVVFGDGAVAWVAEELDRLGSRRTVVIAGARHRDVAADVGWTLGPRLVGEIDEVRPHVPADLVDTALAFVDHRDADALVSLGGGSAIGLAKALARQRPMVLVAVPTTYSGSEMTAIWGTTTAGEKRTGSDPRVVPDAVVYDPELTRSMEPAFAAASGMNAVAHCVEAFYAPGRNPITDLAAGDGLRRLAGALPRVVATGDRHAGREALLGACLAGMVITQAGTSFHHKICHSLGGRFDLPHAETHAALLPHSVAAAVVVAPAAADRLGKALATDDPAGAVADLAGRVGAPASLAALGLPADHLDEAIDLAAGVAAASDLDLPRSRVDALLRGAFGGRPG